MFNSYREIREGETRLRHTLEGTSHVLLAVKDRALSEVFSKVGANRVAVHFSGAVCLEGVGGAHPLMTFGEKLESPDWYRRIPFIVDSGQVFSNLLPGFPNTHFSLRPDKKVLYHALCSLAGNSTYLLWQRITCEFKETLGLPPEALSGFFHQVADNAIDGGTLNFTGPVARGDWGVVQAHLEALAATPTLMKAYKSYLSLAAQSGYPPPPELLL
jgi:predicted short-subunit dehydrogenase-like oxidoreductase (DUF2520 family)